jgi:WD40 repeat protein
MNVCLTRWAIGTVIACAIFALVTGAVTKAQRLSGFDLAIVEVDGTRRVLGRLPLSVFAPRLSPDGKRIAFETRDRSGPDGARLWIAELSDLAGRRPVANPVGPVIGRQYGRSMVSVSCSSYPVSVAMPSTHAVQMGAARPSI